MSIIAARPAESTKPTDILQACMIATFVATMVAMFAVSFGLKINVLQPA